MALEVKRRIGWSMETGIGDGMSRIPLRSRQQYGKEPFRLKGSSWRILNIILGWGERILFWQDRWVGDRTLVAQFPDMFNYAMDKEAKVK